MYNSKFTPASRVAVASHSVRFQMLAEPSVDHLTCVGFRDTRANTAADKVVPCISTFTVLCYSAGRFALWSLEEVMGGKVEGAT